MNCCACGKPLPARFLSPTDREVLRLMERRGWQIVTIRCENCAESAKERKRTNEEARKKQLNLF